ncbi:hypothetical protein BC628DRAFT_1337390 [Trametes gibbosa]|nr:hypothetical protein BC628DRAFT_1337390 [Trametes gibbosa]
MPTYYVQPGQHAQVHYQRPRAYSQSQAYAVPQPVVYTHSGSSHHSSPQRRATAYPQSGAYQSSPQYLTPNYQYDASRRHQQQHHHQGHARTGSGGTYYASSAPAQHRDSTRHSPSSSNRCSTSHGRHHRSHSVPRNVQVVDPRAHHQRSSSHARQSLPVVAHHDRRPSYPVGEPLSERIRRMFGFGHHSSHTQHREYADARSGRTVDWRGRPIYRV